MNSLISFPDLIVLFPFHIPIYVPSRLFNAILTALRTLRVIPRKQKIPSLVDEDNQNGNIKNFVVLQLPMNFVTAPLVAVLFLLAITAIGRQEVSLTFSGVNFSFLDDFKSNLLLSHIVSRRVRQMKTHKTYLRRQY